MNKINTVKFIVENLTLVFFLMPTSSVSFSLVSNRWLNNTYRQYSNFEIIL